MEPYLYICLICITALNLVLVLKSSISLDSIKIWNNQLDESLDEIDDKIVAFSHQIDHINRSMSSPKDEHQPTKPMKSNNWDSIEAAFKRKKTRIDIDERD